MICTDQVFLGDDVEVDKMGGVCGTNGREHECINNFDGET